MSISTNIWFCLITPLVGGFVSAFFTKDQVKSSWYKNLRKPSFNPPDKVFGPVWTILYLAQGLALFLFHKAQTNAISPAPYYDIGVKLFWAQLILNFVWSNLFFVSKEITLALIDMTFMVVLTVLTMVCFATLSTTSVLLMVPYLSWITFATFLTYKIRQLNPDFKNVEGNQPLTI